MKRIVLIFTALACMSTAPVMSMEAPAAVIQTPEKIVTQAKKTLLTVSAKLQELNSKTAVELDENGGALRALKTRCEQDIQTLKKIITRYEKKGWSRKSYLILGATTIATVYGILCYFYPSMRPTHWSWRSWFTKKQQFPECPSGTNGQSMIDGSQRCLATETPIISNTPVISNTPESVCLPGDVYKERSETSAIANIPTKIETGADTSSAADVTVPTDADKIKHACNSLGWFSRLFCK